MLQGMLKRSGMCPCQTEIDAWTCKALPNTKKESRKACEQKMRQTTKPQFKLLNYTGVDITITLF